MLRISSARKFQMAFLVLVAMVYFYRENIHHVDFVSQIPTDVNKCVDREIERLLPSNDNDDALVEEALSSCSDVVEPWLKSITISDDDYGMTLSYLQSHYISEIKYARQPLTGG